MSRPSPKKNKRRDRRKRRDTHRPKGRRGSEPEVDVDLAIPRSDLAHPPVFIDDAGAVVPNPYAILGLAPDAPIDPEDVQAKFRAALAQTSPEADPARARDLLEARNTLLDPKLALRRVLGDLRAPRTEVFLPGHESRESEPRDEAAETDWSSRSRLVAAAALFALLDSEIEDGEPPPAAKAKVMDEDKGLFDS